MQILTPEQLDSKTVEKWFNKIEKIAIKEEWLCTKCHNPSTQKNKPLFWIKDYLSTRTPFGFFHKWC